MGPRMQMTKLKSRTCIWATLGGDNWQPPPCQWASLPKLVRLIDAVWVEMACHLWPGPKGRAAFQEGFRHDFNPAREVALWQVLTRRFAAQVRPEHPPGRRKEMVDLLVAASVHGDATLLRYKRRHVSLGDAQRLLAGIGLTGSQHKN